MPGTQRANFIAFKFAPFAEVGVNPPAASPNEDISALVLFAGEDLTFGPEAAKFLDAHLDTVKRAARAAKFKGKFKSAVEILAPQGLGWDRLLIVGCAPPKDEALDYAALGGYCAGKIGAKSAAAAVFDLPEAHAEQAAAFAYGAILRSYRFDRYQTKSKDEADKDKDGKEGAKSEKVLRLTLAVANPDEAKAAFAPYDALANGVYLTRDLVNEPPNILFPAAFADRVRHLAHLGVEVEILDKDDLEKMGMRTLLAVAQGSANDARVVFLRWRGGGDAQPIAFVGKGVCFDSGGISIKPAGGMEDMKGDMAGAAVVVGLMQTLAARKAKVNAVGAIGLVENMPDGLAQRPSDIVKSLSGQTIEVINTDAEGRLVLADLLWRVQDQEKPQAIIDLATLTGAILVSLGQEYAGLFSNNDVLAERIVQAGETVKEKSWRMPLHAAYEKMIESKVADMKNVGGRYAGSITAAQFLKRFVNDVPWAHLDIAGTASGAPSTEINHSWGTGWGVRLLDQLVRAHYEK